MAMVNSNLSEVTVRESNPEGIAGAESEKGLPEWQKELSKKEMDEVQDKFSLLHAKRGKILKEESAGFV